MEIGSKNLQFSVENTENVTLVAGTYTAGQIVVFNGTAWEYGEVSNAKQALVLLQDVVTATDGDRAIGATGTFNGNIVTVSSVAAGEELGAVLQNKGIYLKTAIKK